MFYYESPNFYHYDSNWRYFSSVVNYRLHIHPRIPEPEKHAYLTMLVCKQKCGYGTVQKGCKADIKDKPKFKEKPLILLIFTLAWTSLLGRLQGNLVSRRKMPQMYCLQKYLHNVAKSLSSLSLQRKPDTPSETSLPTECTQI